MMAEETHLYDGPGNSGPSYKRVSDFMMIFFIENRFQENNVIFISHVPLHENV